MYVRRDGRDVRSVEIMDMISIVMAKSPKNTGEVMRVSSEEVSKRYAIHVKMGPVRSGMQATGVVGIGMMVT